MTSIQWTNETWNPITGCSKVSQGCKNCYAERIWKKVYGMRPFTDVQVHENRLAYPLKWKSPRMIFVNSMSDMFHESVSDHWLDRIFAVMALCPQHIFQILTKRSDRMRDYMNAPGRASGIVEMMARESFDEWTTQGRSGKLPSAASLNHGSEYDPLIQIKPEAWPPKHIWMGVSVEDQKTADERIPVLMQTPAAVRWISAEPLLEGIRLTRHHQFCPEHDFPGGFCTQWHPGVRSIDWVIVGGESGTKEKSRPLDLRWVYELKAQCATAQIPLFVKQLGRNPVFSGGPGQACATSLKFKDSHGGAMSEWPEDIRIREFPR